MFVLFRRCLDAEMKNGVREGLHIKCKKEEREFVSEEEEVLGKEITWNYIS